MAYAYCDKHDTLHIVDKMETALNNHGKGRVVETNYPHQNGYPIHKGESVFVYPDEGKAFIGGNTPQKGKSYDLQADFALAEIVRQVKGE